MDQRELFRYVIDVLERNQLNYMLVGSFASGYFGEPRYTFDIDIVVELFDSNVAGFCEAFAPPQFYLSEHAMREAIRKHSQFNVVDVTSGYKIDFMMIRQDAWGRMQFERRQRRPVLADQDAFTAAIEDVIIGKLWYYDDGGSDKHLRDIASMLLVQRTPIDTQYIDHWVKELGFEDGWNAVKAKVSESDSEL